MLFTKKQRVDLRGSNMSGRNPAGKPGNLKRDSSTFSKGIDPLVNKNAVLKALKKCAKKRDLIAFPNVFHVLSGWRIHKDEKFEFLRALQNEGRIKIVPHLGIMIQVGRS